MAAEPSRRASVIRLAIVVEGDTEEEFVKQLLALDLRKLGVEPCPIKPGGRGGNISVERLVPQMVKLQWNFDFVTSLVDLYGFRKRLPGETAGELEKRIDLEVDKQITHDWDQSRVFAYVQQHEFEGLLFSETDAFRILPDIPLESVESLRQIRDGFNTPEDIDDGPQTAPSKRIGHAVMGYNKRLYGPLIAIEAGLETIRKECPRFNGWMNRLESLEASPPT